MKISQALQGFRIARLADGYSESTLVVYEWALNELKSFLGDPHVEDVTLDKLRSYMYHLRQNYRTKKGTQLSGSSLDNNWKAIRSFFRWCSEDLDIGRPDLDLPRPKYTSKEIRPFSQEEIRDILEACTHTKRYDTQDRKAFRRMRPTAYRDTAIIMVLLDTGIRVSELCRLEVKDVNLETGEVIVRPHGTGQKTKPRSSFVGRRSKKALWRYLQETDLRSNDLLFYSINDRPMNRRSVHNLLQNIGNNAGVDNVHPHRFRHTFATEFLRNGGTIGVLQRILGHSTLSMVLRYAQITNSDIADIQRHASPGDNLRL